MYIPETGFRPKTIINFIAVSICSAFKELSIVVVTVTVELQWLKHIWSQENILETGVVRASEC